MSRLKKIMELRRQLRELGDYDTSIAGAIGEIYAEEVLGMVKADKGTKGIDGHINGRAVQVKTKDGKPRPNTQVYAGIKLNKHLAQDLVMIMIEGDEISHVGPAPIDELPFYENKTERRYYLSKLKEYLSSK